MTIFRHLYSVKLTLLSAILYTIYHDSVTGSILVCLALIEILTSIWSSWLHNLTKLDKAQEIEARLQRCEAMLATIEQGRGY